MRPRTTLGEVATGTLLLIVLAFCLAGCPAGKHTPATRTDPATTLGEGQRKDDAIGDEARGIVSNPTDSAFVSAAASRILDVLRLSPWSKTEATIKAIVGERDAALSANADLRAQLDKANQKTDQIIRLGLAGAGGVCFILAAIAGVLVAKASTLFPGLGKWIVGCLGALGATFLFAAFAYGWALRHQTLVISIAGVCVVGAAFLWISNRHHAASSQ